MKILLENIFNSNNHFLLQILDCTSIYTREFSQLVENNYPGTTPYVFRKQIAMGYNIATLESRSTPGSVFIMETQDGTKGIINVFGRYCPINTFNTFSYELAKEAGIKDDSESQQVYFQEALNSLEDYFFGCKKRIVIDVSKSNFENKSWNYFLKHLENFENRMVKNNYDFEFFIFP